MPACCPEPSLAVPVDFGEGKRPLAQGQPLQGGKTGISGARSSTCLGYKRETGTVGRDPAALAH